MDKQEEYVDYTDCTKENQIVVEYPKKKKVRDMLIPLTIAGFGVFLMFICYYFRNVKGDKEMPDELSLMGFGVICIALLFLIKVICYSLTTFRVIIDDKGVIWGWRKKFYPWEKINNLALTIKEQQAKAGTFYVHFLYCVLNDGRRLKANITKSNYSADVLVQDINIMFPKVNCFFIDPRLK